MFVFFFFFFFFIYDIEGLHNCCRIPKNLLEVSQSQLSTWPDLQLCALHSTSSSNIWSILFKFIPSSSSSWSLAPSYPTLLSLKKLLKTHMGQQNHQPWKFDWINLTMRTFLISHYFPFLFLHFCFLKMIPILTSYKTWQILHLFIFNPSF